MTKPIMVAKLGERAPVFITEKDKKAVAIILGYYREHGRSSYLIRCQCGSLFDFFVWSFRKRCPGCKAMFVYGNNGITKNGEIVRDYND